MIILYVCGSYFVLGLIFSIPFLSRWIHLVDETTRGSGLDFKLTILPGCIVFWPILLKKLWDIKVAKK